MKKIICLLLALMMTVSILAACNKDKPVEVPDEPDNQDEIQEGEDVMDTGKLVLVADGLTDYVIVRGEDAYVSEVTASTELQNYIKQISGVEIPIVTDSAAPVEKEIIVGKTNRESDGEFDRTELGDDGLVIKTNGKKLFLVGGEKRGTLYAVYEFLESYLGCRFYTKTVEKIPEIKTIALDSITEDKQIPTVMFREMGWLDWDKADYCVKRKINSSWSAPLSDEWGGREPWVGGHSMSMLLNPSQYYAEHPEYFAMQKNGERASSAGFDGPQACLSNPEVINILIENVRNWIKSTPGVKIFHIGQNDNQDYCVCDECVKIYNEEGGALSGTMIRAVNTIAEALADEFPDVIFQTYAYQYTRSAPITKVADNVMIMLCNIERCVSHHVDKDCFGSHNATFMDGSYKTFAEDLEDWKNVADKIYIYDYNANYANYHLLMSDFYNLYYDTRYYVSNHAVGILSQGKTQGYDCEFGELRTYLLSKLFWNPDMTEEEYWEYLNDFLEGVYGPGWKYLREYIDLAETLTEDKCWGIFDDPEDMLTFETIEVNAKDSYPEELTADMLLNYETVDWNKYWNWFKSVKENPITEKGYELFAKAIEMAETESQKTQLDKVSIQLDLIKSYYLHKLRSMGNGSIGKIVANFLTANPDAIDSNLKTQLRVDIIKYANANTGNDYADYNRALVEKMKKYTPYYKEYGPLSSSDSFNYNNCPREWLD